MIQPFKCKVFAISFFLILPFIAFAGELKVVRVTDGDTIKAAADHMEIVVRLVGIDAPEKSRKKHESGQPFSQKATKYLASKKAVACGVNFIYPFRISKIAIFGFLSIYM